MAGETKMKRRASSPLPYFFLSLARGMSLSDRFWADEPGDVLMIESVVILQSICSHGRHKMLAEKIEVAIDRDNPFGSVKELRW